ncbi:MAG: hypothetical protein ACP5XB_11725 [Isosphaeraceae bacterium]
MRFPALLLNSDLYQFRVAGHESGHGERPGLLGMSTQARRLQITAVCERHLAFRAIVSDDRPVFRTDRDERKFHYHIVSPGKTGDN